MNLLPVMITIGDSGFPVETTYWDTDMSADGFYYLVHNGDRYFLFIPKNKPGVIKEMDTAKSIVITRGEYNGRKDCFEIMFDDNSDNPFMLILQDKQFSRISALKEGWVGTFYIYNGTLEEYDIFKSHVYYRVTDNLPYLQSVTEQIDKLHGLTPLSHDEAIAALKAGEYLVNGKEAYGVAHYHWYEDHILESDSYYDLVGEGNKIPENEIPQLYRMGNGNFGNWTTHAMAQIKSLLETKKFPLLSKKFTLDKLTEQIVNVFSKNNKKIHNTNFEIILTQLEKFLEADNV
jgi:hypothetical protein